MQGTNPHLVIYVCVLQVSHRRNVLLCVPRLFGRPTLCAAEKGPRLVDIVLRSSTQQETGTNMDLLFIIIVQLHVEKRISQNKIKYVMHCVLKCHLYWLQVTSGGLAVYLSRDQEVWLETKDYKGMRGSPAGYSIFSGFLLHAH